LSSQSGYSYGFGFANFIRDEDAFEAMKGLNGFQVENKRLKVSFARPPSDDIKDTNVYITNLPRGTTEKDLLDMFGQFGNIVQKNLLHDKTTGRSRGTAFVR
jgi:protein sex-lethal